MTDSGGPRNALSVEAGSRWFRARGGMPSLSLTPLSGRYLSFQQREEISLRRVQGVGIREIARELRRDPSTISRELRRSAASRGRKLEYQASVAQRKQSQVYLLRVPADEARTGRADDWRLPRLSVLTLR